MEFEEEVVLLVLLHEKLTEKKRKHTLLLAVADSNYRFIFVDFGSYGKCSDSSIFKNSALRKRIQENTLNISPGKPLDDTCGPFLLYVFVGDEVFGLSTNLLRPYGGKNLSKKKRIFNYRLS
ncbi:hypothetical protein Cfor_11134 [Coptotermes formosanus]|uniref:DDE Tnp4 domain-containing protein n=1 Tax=Coptotermes formosanus TaxID=36987 RepID=A0A6L2PGD6_COPFO|nr:hypothetical protein Cfor_11134 [Coptotermes formosanus]